MKKQQTTLHKIVSILNDGQYHDGTEIGAAIGISRAAVWKAVKKLLQYGINIDSVKGKGYALLEPLIMLDADSIKKQLNNKKIELQIFESIDSTNAYLAKHKPKRSLAVCLAEQQTQGKGRMQRDWHSPFGKNLYLSCYYSFQKDISELAGLSMIVSLSIRKTLQSFGLMDSLSVKWPNDVVYDNKKIAGNLIEVRAETHGVSHAVIGVGINVNMTNANKNEIGQAWTSISGELNKPIDRNECCARFLNILFSDLEQFERDGFAPAVQEWMRADCLTNKKIILNTLKENVHGQVVGINEYGHVLLKLKDGTVSAFSAGDATVQK